MAAEVLLTCFKNSTVKKKKNHILIHSQALASRVSEQDLAEGRLYPPLATIRDCSTAIAAYIAEHAYKNGSKKICAFHLIDF